MEDVLILEKVVNEIERLSVERKAHLKAIRGRFNLFCILLHESDEVRLHTRYLTHLLNPTATHDCGRLFLDSFLNTIGLTHKSAFGKCLCVANEHYTGGLGNIDIFIEFEKAIVVIENKIWAGDQDGQLERYYKYSEQKKKKVYLYYLTLDGHDPSDVSAGMLKKSEEIRIVEENNYYCISYRKHILDWIEKCCQNTYTFININQALQQYQMVVNQLLGNTLEAEDMKKIKDVLRGNPQLMANLENAIASIKQDREKETQQLIDMINVDKDSSCDIWIYSKRCLVVDMKLDGGILAFDTWLEFNGWDTTVFPREVILRDKMNKLLQFLSDKNLIVAKKGRYDRELLFEGELGTPIADIADKITSIINSSYNYCKEKQWIS